MFVQFEKPQSHLLITYTWILETFLHENNSHHYDHNDLCVPILVPQSFIHRYLPRADHPPYLSPLPWLFTPNPFIPLQPASAAQMQPGPNEGNILTLKVLVTTTDALGPLLNRIITAQWEGMGDVGSARYEVALLPPCPTIRVLKYSNCQRSTHSISKWFS